MLAHLSFSALVISLLLSACSPPSNEPAGNEQEPNVVNQQSLDAEAAPANVVQRNAESAPKSSKGEASGKLPDHEIEVTALTMKSGKRVQVNVNSDISKAECLALITRYKAQGEPDGQISVRKPSAKSDGMLTPWCVENFDGRDVGFNDYMF